MNNSGLEKALEETWKNKERFYEDTKGLSMAEIIKKIENKYKVQRPAAAMNGGCYPSGDALRNFT